MRVDCPHDVMLCNLSLNYSMVLSSSQESIVCPGSKDVFLSHTAPCGIEIVNKNLCSFAFLHFHQHNFRDMSQRSTTDFGRKPKISANHKAEQSKHTQAMLILPDLGSTMEDHIGHE